MVDRIRWVDEQVCEIGETRFLTLGSTGTAPDLSDEGYRTVFALGAASSNADRFVLLKTRALIDLYATVIDELRPKRIVQLGVFQGGSVAMVNELAAPERLVALELARARVPALDDYLTFRGLQDVVQVHHGVDQGDVAAVRELTNQIDGDLDLVVDDASHQLDPTLASFDLLFPRLRPGGAYVIEDWAMGAVPPEHPVIAEHLRSLGPPLTRMLQQLLMTCISQRQLVAAVSVSPEALVVRRGPGAVGEGFTLVEAFSPAVAEAFLRLSTG